MEKPDGDKYVGTPRYLRELLQGAGITQGEAARLLRINLRTFRSYCSEVTPKKYPYTTQYAVEVLAHGTECVHDKRINKGEKP